MYISVLNLCLRLTCFLVPCMCAFIPGRASASFFPDDLVTEQAALVEEMAGEYSDLRDELILTDPEEWTTEETMLYLDVSLWSIYLGLTYYFFEYGSLPNNLEALAGTRFIPVWPDNPYNAWQPVEVLTLAEGFSPGEVTLQVCPSTFYSYEENTRPVSCELSIFGPAEEFGQLGDPEPCEESTWVEIPTGAVFMLGQFANPAA